MAAPFGAAGGTEMSPAALTLKQMAEQHQHKTQMNMGGPMGVVRSRVLPGFFLPSFALDGVFTGSYRVLPGFHELILFFLSLLGSYRVDHLFLDFARFHLSLLGFTAF